MSDGPSATPGRLIGEVRITAGPGAGQMFALRDDTVIGRDDAADIVLADASGELSRRHARLVVQGGVPVVEDLGSTNGTFVNNERIQRRQLRTGDLIRVGASTLEFTAAEPVAQPDVTKARAIPGADVTRARDIPAADVTAAREIPEPDVTRARDVPPADVSPPPRRGWTPALPPSEPLFAPAGSEAQLRILRGPGQGRTAQVVAGSATVGREPECDLQVLDSEVSRRHAKFTIRAGVATLDDLSSANGTYVNGDRILKTHTLAPGDMVDIGEATIEITSPAFEGDRARTVAPQISGLRDVLAQPVELLTAEEGNRKWWTLAVVCTTVFMLLLDVTIVGVALPAISADLDPSFSSLQWVVDAYTLGLTVALLTAGSFADIFGRRKILTYGLAMFTVASVACAQAPNATVLDFARAIQGLGGAMMLGCSLALIVQEFAPRERAVAFGIFGAVSGLSVALGPILGGLLVDNIGWESIFYINVPIAALCFVMLRLKVVNLPGPSTSIDWGGLATSSSAMFLAIFATIRAGEEGWTSPLILACFAGSIILGAAFVAIELRRAQPMLDMRLFRNPTFVGSSIAAFTLCFAVLAQVFFLTVWLQSVLGYSAVEAGLRMLAMTGAALLIAPLAGRMTATVNPRITLTIGLAAAAAGAATMISVDGDSSWTAILPGLFLGGLGLGLVNPTLSSTAASVVPPWRSGMASAMADTSREAGTTAGIAVLGTLAHHQINENVRSSLADSPLAGSSEMVAEAISVGGTQQVVAAAPEALRPALLDAAQVSYAAALSHLFVVTAAVAAVGAIVTFALVRREHLRAGAMEGGGH